MRWRSPESYDFISSIAGTAAQDGGDPMPVFRVSVKPPRSSPFSAHPGKLAITQSERDPDSVWREVFSLHRVATELRAVPDDAAQEGGAPPETTAPIAADQSDEGRREALRARPQLCAALAAATLPPVHWGTLLFGLAEVRTHQLLEALPNALCCPQYTSLQVRCALCGLCYSVSEAI